MIAYKDLVVKTMPPEKKRTASRCVVGHYLVRPISNIISIPLIEMNINPTSVTIISLLPVLMAFGFFVTSRTTKGFVIGWFLIFLWNILDGVDGNIARYCEKSSIHGEIWDATVGWIAVIVFYEGMGFSAYKFGIYIQNTAFYLCIGGLTAILSIFPRLIMHKKASIVGSESTKELKNLKPEGAISLKDIVKLILFNLISINGVAAIFFLVCLLTDTIELCMWGYFVLNLIVTLGSLYTLLKK